MKKVSQILLMFLLVYSTGCQKEVAKEVTSLENYKLDLSDYLVKVKNDFEINTGKTEIKNLNENVYFETPVSQAGKPIGVLLGYITKDKKYYNVLWIAEKLDEKNSIVSMRLLNNKEIGRVDIVNGIVRTNQLSVRQSWWSCTMDCIGDSHIACGMDATCTALLIGSNIAGRGAASGSIAAACGISCVGNTNMDLLPQF